MDEDIKNVWIPLGISVAGGALSGYGINKIAKRKAMSSAVPLIGGTAIGIGLMTVTSILTRTLFKAFGNGFSKTKGLVTTYGNAPTNRAVPDGYLVSY